MGGVCSRKRDQRDNEDNLPRGVSGRYFKSGSSKWLATSFSRPAIDVQLGRGKCPSLLYLCIRKILEVIFLFFLMLKSPCILVSSKKKKRSPCILAYLFCIFFEQDIDRYSTFSMLPRDISQQIFNELVYSHRLNDVSLEAFRDCALQVAHSELFGKLSLI